MGAYPLAVLALSFAATAQTVAAWLCYGAHFRLAATARQRYGGLALCLAAAFLALQHGYTLELALRTGLFDLRQALLSALVACLFVLGIFFLRRSPP